MKTILSLSRSLIGYTLLYLKLDDFLFFLDLSPRQCFAAVAAKRGKLS
jgi:hypothetical protein